MILSTDMTRYILFQSTLPHGSDSDAQKAAFVGQIFQSTLPHGSDDLIAKQYLYRSHFNPRSLTGATGNSGCKAGAERHFNPRSLTGATPRLQGCGRTYQQFQSTLPHGSDTISIIMLQPLSNISIHAPSRERHGVKQDGTPFGAISIHAPSRERRCPERPLS